MSDVDTVLPVDYRQIERRWMEPFIEDLREMADTVGAYREHQSTCPAKAEGCPECWRLYQLATATVVEKAEVLLEYGKSL